MISHNSKETSLEFDLATSLKIGHSSLQSSEKFQQIHTALDTWYVLTQLTANPIIGIVNFIKCYNVGRYIF